MEKSKQLFEITKQKFGLRFDRELADLLGIKNQLCHRKFLVQIFLFFKFGSYLLNEV